MSDVNLSKERAGKLSLGAAVLGALAASSCCVGPLVLAALGLGGAGAFAALTAYRPYILGVTAVLLAIGFYLTYRKPGEVEGDACGCTRPKANRAGRVGLWTATALVVAFAAAPALLARVAGSHSPSAASISHDGEQTVVQVRGIDCEACAAPMRSALTKVGGFRDLRLDVAQQTVTVTYEPAPGRLAAYVAVLNDLGYEASIPSNAGAGKVR